MGYTVGVPRLGIPGLRLADGPPGVLTRHPSHAETATMGVAATFSRKTAEQNGETKQRPYWALNFGQRAVSLFVVDLIYPLIDPRIRYQA